MEPEIDYQSIPTGYAHCFNEKCACADQCLRRLAALHIPADQNTVVAVNPGRTMAGGTSCPFFRPKKLLRLAVGMLHLYDNLNYRDALAVRREISRNLGRGIYYRIRNSERPLTPAEHSYVKRVFKKYGITSEPLFGGYKETYDW